MLIQDKLLIQTHVLEQEEIKVFPYSKQDYIGCLKLINRVGNDFIPPITERTTEEGYLNFLLASNDDVSMEYARTRYGKTWQRPKGARTFIAKANGRIVGFASSWDHLKVPYDCGVFVCYMIDPYYQQNGIGSKLLQSSLSAIAVSGVKRVVTTTWSTNIGSIRTFEKHGFNLRDRILNKRAPGIDELVFQCDIVS